MLSHEFHAEMLFLFSVKKFIIFILFVSTSETAVSEMVVSLLQI